VRLCLVVIIAVACSWSGQLSAQTSALPAATARSRAEPSAATSEAYQQAISSAVEEYDTKNYAEAREQFRRAHALFPNARTLRGLAMAEFELRHYVESIDYFEQALASDVKPLEGALRADTLATRERARNYVGSVRVQVEPATAELVVDGAPRSIDAQPLQLVVGDHVLEFRALGRQPHRRTITIEGGQNQSIDVRLLELEAGAGSPAALLARARPTADKPLVKSWWLWGAVAVVAGGAAVTTALLLNRGGGQEEEDLITLHVPSAGAR
jgi:tetratricopeptide (TPR) repeat protein